jgi:hypothetical protein
MALLVQNALGDVSSLVDQFAVDGGELTTGQEALQSTESDIPFQEEPPQQIVSFMAEPLNAIRIMSITALGNLVSWFLRLLAVLRFANFDWRRCSCL